MTERPHEWVVLGRTIVVQGDPETIARVEDALHHLEQKVGDLRRVHPHQDELTLFLMGVVALLEELTGCLAEYEAFCQAIETWLPTPEKNSQV
jgi:cell division protein ZapA (FtsZ GTPase activity inhibitor)